MKAACFGWFEGEVNVVPLAARLSQFFNRKGIDFQCLHHDRVDSLAMAIAASGVPADKVVMATFLIDLKGVVMAVHPYQATLDVDAICRSMGRRLQTLTATQADRLFPDCETGMHPPIGAAYSVPVVVEESLLSAEVCYMPSGCRTTLLEMDGRSFRLAMAGASRARFSIMQPVCDISEKTVCSGITLEDIAARLQKLYRLPAMPAIALRILQLTADDNASARELSTLIDHDPSLAAQIMRYARSALFNYQGDIQSVQDAVTRVLGFERVAHMAMGIAASRAFNVPRDGMLGLDAFWRHSLYCAYLSQRIAERANPTLKMDPALAYLCGLLHNFGLLLIAHLFPPEFRLLNKLRDANPEQPLAALEQQVFGMGQAQDVLMVGHGAIGGILLKLWQLPEAVIKSAGMHQHAGYQGEQAPYIWTVQLANILLKREMVGDEFNEEAPEDLAESLGLDEQALGELMACTEEAAGELDALANALAA